VLWDWGDKVGLWLLKGWTTAGASLCCGNVRRDLRGKTTCLGALRLMKRLASSAAVILSLLCCFCAKHQPAQLADFTEEDVRRELTNSISRDAVVRIFGQPVTEMETSDTGYMLRFRSSQSHGEFLGVDAYFVNDSLTRWSAWKSGDPALPESR
jgi:hypothetical protein